MFLSGREIGRREKRKIGRKREKRKIERKTETERKGERIDAKIHSIINCGNE